MFAAGGRLLATGWSGRLAGKNNPVLEPAHNIGPIPRGTYAIGAPENYPHTGPYSLPLTPGADNQMFGRAAFLIHGAARVNPELSSEGCIILAPDARVAIWQSGDHELVVV